MEKRRVHLHLCGIKFTLFAVVIFLFYGNLYAVGDDYKKTKITLTVKEMELSKVLDALAEKAHVRFFYNHAQMDDRKKITADFNGETLDRVLLVVLGGMDVDVEYQIGRVIMLKLRMKQSAGTSVIKVSGKVIDAVTKEGLPGGQYCAERKARDGSGYRY